MPAKAHFLEPHLLEHEYEYQVFFMEVRSGIEFEVSRLLIDITESAFEDSSA